MPVVEAKNDVHLTGNEETLFIEFKVNEESEERKEEAMSCVW